MTSSSAPSPDRFKPLYKQHRRVKRAIAGLDQSILIPSQLSHYTGPFNVTSTTLNDTFLAQHFNEFVGDTLSIHASNFHSERSSITIDNLPGLQIFPGLIPSRVQKQIVTETVEHYIPEKLHKSNLTPHYELPERLELFNLPSDLTVIPKPEFSFLKPLTIAQIRESKLRWITLGGQYNWTDKVYPSFEKGSPEFPEFPAKLANLLKSIFHINPQAAIINFYSPGDTLSPHQDVAEVCNADLISLSIGCDCIFYCATSRTEEPLSILLQSGDVVIMGGKSRKAFHGVGRVFENTCPEYLLDIYESWMSSKRINVNVRQMF